MRVRNTQAQQPPPPPRDLNTVEGLEWFRHAVESHRKKIGGDREKSRAYLVELGLFTKAGRLTKKYR